MTMDYSPWSEREIWPFLRVAISPKPEKSHSPWSEREIWPFLKVAIALKPERPRPLKLVCMDLT